MKFLKSILWVIGILLVVGITINNFNNDNRSLSAAPAPSIETNVQKVNQINVIAALDPLKVESIIKKGAEIRWRDDYDMQVYEIKKQTKAYNELVNIPLDDKTKISILNRAYDKWNSDYVMVLYEYKKQLKSFEELKNINNH